MVGEGILWMEMWGIWAVWCGPSSTFIGPLSWTQTHTSLEARNADRSRASRVRQLQILIWVWIVDLVCNVRTTVVGTISHQPNLGSLLTSVWSWSKITPKITCWIIRCSPRFSNLVAGQPAQWGLVPSQRLPCRPTKQCRPQGLWRQWMKFFLGTDLHLRDRDRRDQRKNNQPQNSGFELS